jgi:ABC-type sugar transport system ATPase subunit
MRSAMTVEDGQSLRPDTPGESVLRASGPSKRYGGVQALNDVDLDLRAGETLALAGKSTVIGLLGGARRQDVGVVELLGQETRFHSAAEWSATTR